MKAYVIKRKGNEYLSNKPYIWTKQIAKARMFIHQGRINAEISRYSSDNAVVVPIIIIEGDLEEHDKQVREQVCNSIKDIIDREGLSPYDLTGIFEEVKNGKTYK